MGSLAPPPAPASPSATRSNREGSLKRSSRQAAGHPGGSRRLPNPGAQYSVLNSVSCLSPTDCVAVGFDGSGSVEGSAGLAQSLIETWDGTEWTVTTSGNPVGDSVSVLNSVSCTNSDYCVAAGYEEAAGDAQTLTEVLKGDGWSVVPSANGADGDSILNGVSCTSSTHCVAVGVNDTSGISQSLIETWDGSQWSTSPSADAGSPGNIFYGMGDNILYSVSCSTTSDCMAVGAYITEGRLPQALVEQSDSEGRSWAPASSDNPGSGGDILDGVSCTTPISCVAVGFDDNGSTDGTLDENWDGSQWFATASPSPGAVSNFLTSVWCGNPASCVGVGDDGDGTGSTNQTLIMNFAPQPPSPPTSVLASAGLGEASVSFAEPADNGGSEITGYTVTATDVTNLIRGGQTAAGSESPIVISGLTAGDSYTFSVTATNATGTGLASSPSNAVVIAGVIAMSQATTFNLPTVHLSDTAPLRMTLGSYSSSSKSAPSVATLTATLAAPLRRRCRERAL